MVSSSSKSTKSTKILPPPTFQLPPLLDTNRYELWSIRIPHSLDPMSLDGTSLSFPSSKDINVPTKNATSSLSTLTIPLVNFNSNSKVSMGLFEGNALEMENVRLLLPSPGASHERLSQENDDDDDDVVTPRSQHPYSMIPTPHSIQRHFHLLSHSNSNSTPPIHPPPPPLHVPPGTHPEGILSDSPSNTVIQDLSMKIAYSPKDQVMGLKRRWTAVGGNTEIKWDPSLNHQLPSSSVSDSSKDVDGIPSPKKLKKVKKTKKVKKEKHRPKVKKEIP